MGGGHDDKPFTIEATRTAFYQPEKGLPLMFHRTGFVRSWDNRQTTTESNRYLRVDLGFDSETTLRYADC